MELGCFWRVGFVGVFRLWLKIVLRIEPHLVQTGLEQMLFRLRPRGHSSRA